MDNSLAEIKKYMLEFLKARYTKNQTKPDLQVARIQDLMGFLDDKRLKNSMR